MEYELFQQSWWIKGLLCGLCKRTEYKFYAWPDMDKKQAFTFSLDEVRRPSGGEPTKYGTFTCDLTDYYQQKYGQDKVKRVVLSYKVVSFRMII